MPVSKKPRKKKKLQTDKASKLGAKTPRDARVPNARAFEGFMSGFGGRPADQAQDVMYDAWECSEPAQRVALARTALEISPLCADAYVLLAEEAARSQEEALAYFKQAVEVGAEALGPGAFKEYAGHFWGFVETRPYMRARAGLAEALWVTGKREEAIGHYKEMLALNPGDNQGIRYILAAKLLEMGWTEDLKAHLRMHEDEASTDIFYTRALVAYLDGDAKAEELAHFAWECNQHVPGILSDRIPKVEMTDYVTLGGKDEATSYVLANGGTWEKTQGAIEWLVEVTKDLKPRQRGTATLH